jgi:predicted transcriptional regulator of viral defense system
MAKYLKKNLNQEQKDFLIYLDNEEIEIFIFSDMESRLGIPNQNLSNILANLIHYGFLVKFEKDKYFRHNFNNNFVIANYLCKNSAIAYWSALNHYGLTEQIPNTIFVQTDKLKRSKKVLNVDYKFIKVHPKKITGITTEGRGSYKFRITDIEKTIIDCFDLPQYSGGFAELVRAFYNAGLNKKKMLDYAIAVDNVSIFKRISYLSELFGMKGFKTFQKETEKRLKNKYTYLSQFSGKTGKYISRWKLCLNVDEKTLFSIIQKEY